MPEILPTTLKSSQLLRRQRKDSLRLLDTAYRTNPQEAICSSVNVANHCGITNQLRGVNARILDAALNGDIPTGSRYFRAVRKALKKNTR